MLEVLFKSLDYLFKIISLHNDRSKTLFNELFKPLFESLKSIHSDYSAIFGGLLADDPSPGRERQWSDKKAKDVAKQLTELRLQFSPLRRQVRGAAQALSSDELSDPAASFARAVVAYFPSGELTSSEWTEAGQGNHSVSSSIIKAIYNDLNTGDTGAFDLRQLLEETLATQEIRWQKVSEEYARLQLYVFS